MINLCIYTSRREYCIPLFAYFLKKMKPENKKQIHVSLLAYGDLNRFAPIIKDLHDNGVYASAPTGFRSEYMEKTTWAVQQNYEYTAKIDEDVFINNHVLDFIVENISVLDAPEHLAITPVLSNGIPTTDMFINSFFEREDQDEIRRLLLMTRFGPLWGTDYTFLNKFTVDAPSGGNIMMADGYRPFFNHIDFYETVRSWPHHYKGIHPVRVNPIAQIRINELILQKYIPKFTEQRTYMFRATNHPYLCNNMFFIRTDKWKKIVNNQSLYVDPFDEVPLSKYKQQSGEKWMVVDGSFGIHTIYNTVYGHSGIQEFEQRFVEELKGKVMV